MNELIIKLATDQDSEKISLLLLDAFKEFQSAYSKEAFLATVITPEEVNVRISEGPLWVAKYQGKLVGTVSILPKKNEIYLRGMAVLPAARGLKIGLRLLQRVEHFAFDNAYKRMFLLSTPYLAKAINLYKKFGFVMVEQEHKDFFGTPCFIMEKNIPL